MEGRILLECTTTSLEDGHSNPSNTSCIITVISSSGNGAPVSVRGLARDEPRYSCLRQACELTPSFPAESEVVEGEADAFSPWVRGK